MDVCTLLIIDNDPGIRTLLTGLLAGREDIHVLLAGSGPEAVTQFASNRVDVILTEINMPGFTGLELVADMKRLKFKPEILVMTAEATPESVETSRTLGARSVMLKPFDDLEVIEAEINKAVTAARAARPGGNAPVADPAPIAPAAIAKPAAAKPAIARPAAAPGVAPAQAAPASEPLPDFDAWNGDLSGNDTPVPAPPPVPARPSPAPIAVAPAPVASLRPVNWQGLRAASKPAPAVAAVPSAPAAAQEPAPVPPAPAAVQRPPAAVPPPAPRPLAPPVPAPVAPVAAPAAPVSAPAAPVSAPAAPVSVPAVAPRAAAPAPRVPAAPPAPAPRPAAVAPQSPQRPAAPVPQPAPRAPVAVKSPAPRPPAAAPRPAGPASSASPAAAHALAPALTPPAEEAVPEIPAALEGIFRTASRFDTGKLRMQVPIICLQTWEEKGAIAALKGLAASLHREFCVWSVGKGLVKENGQSMGDIYRDPGRALEFIRRHKNNGLYLFADFRPFLEDKAVVRLLREMVMELETARSMLVLTGPRLPAPPELQPICAAFDWPAGGSADPLALYEQVAEEVAAATGLGLDVPAAERDALLLLIKDMPAGRARFEIARALMARAG